MRHTSLWADNAEKAGAYLFRDGELTLLTRDHGLTDAVDDSRIAGLLASRRRVDQQCDVLIQAALDGGGLDNVTVVLAEYEIPHQESGA